MIFREYLTTAEICTIHALDQGANKDHPCTALYAWHEHVSVQDYPGGPSAVRGNYIWQPCLVQQPGTISGMTVYRNKTLIIPPSKGKNLLKYKLKASCIT